MGGLGYPTLNHYTSLTDEDYMFTMKKLGYSSYWMEVGSQDGSLLTDALLGNRYTVVQSREVKPEDDVVYQNDWYAILKNKYRDEQPGYFQIGRSSGCDAHGNSAEYF